MNARHPESSVREDPMAVERYAAIKGLGHIFKDPLHPNEITETEVGKAKRFLQEAARVSNPPVWASYWDHALLAPKMGRLVAQAANDHGIDVNPNLVELLLWIHDLSTMVTPGAYLRKDLIGERLLIEAGIPRAIQANLASTAKLMGIAEKLNLDPAQYRWKKPLTQTQEVLAQEYFESQTPTQRICNLADNLGKRGLQGLFNLTTFIEYLKSQEGRYDAVSEWPSVNWAIPRREMGAFLQGLTVENNVNWLRENGVDFDQIRNQLLDYGAKFVIVARHGELDNPRNIVYNRDSVMRSEDIMHLSTRGRDQMRDLASIMNQRGFRVVKTETSPETRTRESGLALNKVLALPGSSITENPDLDDNYSPGPYLEGMTLDQLQEIGGNVYSERWVKYRHETLKSVKTRMNRAFWHMARHLQVDEAGVLVTHGDPLAWWCNVVLGLNSSQDNLRNTVYLSKGQGVVAVLDSNGELFTTYTLNPVPTRNTY